MGGFRDVGSLGRYKLRGPDRPVPHLLPRAKPSREILATFEPDETWTPVRGTVVADTVNYKRGSQGLKLTAVASNWAAADLVLPAPISLHDKALDVWVYVEDASKVNTLVVYASLGVTDFSKLCLWKETQAFTSGEPMVVVTGWNRLSLASARAEDFAGGATRADLHDVRALRVRCTANASGDLTTTFDALDALPVLSDRGKVLLRFDDGEANLYTDVRPLMDKYGYVGNLYIVTGLIGRAGYLTEAQLSLMASNGWAVGGHSVTHPRLSTLTEAEVMRELIDCQRWLASRGYGARAFAYPYSAISADVLRWTAKVYDIATIISRSIAVSSPFTASHALGAQPCTSATLSARKTLLTQIAATKETAHLLIHTVKSSGGDLTHAEFEELLQHIQMLGMDVITIDDILHQHRYAEANRLAARVDSETVEDLEFLDTDKGVILQSPDGTRYRVRVANDGTLSTALVV